ncbi:MAG: arginase family protein [Paracoccaceae bacterium]|nr:MAG: arginase family protein [Paracoccaceae bacterium]
MATLAEMFGGGAETFMGLPADDGRTAHRAVILGADGCTPYASVGFYCEGGPAAIRAAGAAYAANLHHVNFDLGGPVLPPGVTIADAGNVPVTPDDPDGNRDRLRRAVSGIAARGAVPVLLGGDDSLPIPMLQALSGRDRPLTILQIDAHVDWRDEVAGERLGLSSTMRRASEMAHVGTMIQVGQRGIGSARPGDLADAQARGVVFVPASRVFRDGTDAALAAIPPGSDIAICLDVDALDPAIMPAAIGRTAGGLTYWHVVDLIAGAAARGRIVAFDMVELMPARDIDGQGAMLAAQLLATVLGIIARQSG